MRPIGFSTGALAKGDFERALCDSYIVGATAVELSALRWEELGRLQSEFASLSLGGFSFVSVHLPSRFPPEEEARVVGAAKEFIAQGAVVVAHPDAIRRCESWLDLGSSLLIENMDKRKPEGRTADELRDTFVALESAGLCFDIGHVRQVDPSLTEARRMIDHWGSRIRMLHISDVASSSAHEPLSASGRDDVTWLCSLLPANIPAIIEAPVAGDRIREEFEIVTKALESGARVANERQRSIAAA